MPDAVYMARNTVFAATAGTKTALLIAAGANQPVSIAQLSVSMDGATATAVPATVTLEQCTLAGAGTAGGSPPAVVQTGGHAITAQPAVTHNYSAEPTAYTVIDQWFVPQFMGTFVLPITPGQEPDSDLSGGTVKALGVRVNVSANVNVLVACKFMIGG